MKRYYVEKIDNLWHLIEEDPLTGRRVYKEFFASKGEAVRAMEMQERAIELHKRKLKQDVEA